MARRQVFGAMETGQSTHEAMVRRLAGRGAEPLARFILTLARDDNGIGAYVQCFLAGDDLPACTRLIEATLHGIRRGERPYDRRHALDDVYLRRLDHLLDVIELVVLPADPRAAFGLLVQVIEADDDIENLLQEAWTTPTFERAAGLFAAAARAVPAAEVGPVVARLLARDNFGHRAGLRRCVGEASIEGQR